MPKINVYVPDDLAASVRETGIPVSAVCQKALADAVRSIGRARRTVEAIRDPSFDPTTVPQIGNRLGSYMTLRLREAIRLAREAAGSAGCLETKHLLVGLLDEGHNLAVRLLRALEVDTDELRAAAAQTDVAEAVPPYAYEPGAADSRADTPLWVGLTVPSRMGIAAALEASIDLGHNYLGCEHLLLGLLNVDDGGAARALHSFGVDETATRRALTTAIAGLVHARETPTTPETSKLDEVVRRLDAIESRLASAGA